MRFAGLRFDVIPEEPRQAHRLRRFFLGCGGVAVVLTLLALYVYAGWMAREALAALIVILAAGCAFFYAWLRSGLNLRSRDPSLTAPMMIASTAVMLFAIRAAPEGRALLVLAYLVPLFFGIFRLSPRQIALFAAAFMLGYGAILWEAWPADGTNAWRVALVQWLVPAVVLSWFAGFAGYLSRLREHWSRAHVDLVEALERARTLILQDDLTGLYTRRHLMEVLERERRTSQRASTGFCVLMLDLDRFKNINDSHGHAAGDEVLRSFARTLRPLIRPADVLGRYGGEEFLIVCGGGTSLEGARTLAERIRQAVETMVVPGLPPGFRVTVSVGVAEFLAGESPEELLVRADRALYVAKQGGRNRVEVAANAPAVPTGA